MPDCCKVLCTHIILIQRGVDNPQAFTFDHSVTNYTVHYNKVIKITQLNKIILKQKHNQYSKSKRAVHYVA